MSAPDTRSKIIDAAECLYALRGIDGVSLREISAAAGQRNNSAVQYHFGGRDGLVRAVFEHRFAALDRRRAELLGRLDARDRAPTLHELVELLVLPFGEAPASDRLWVRFVARLHEEPAFNPFAAARRGEAVAPYAASDELAAATRDITRRIAERLTVPPELVSQRFFLATTMIVRSVADREALAAAGMAANLEPRARFLTDLVDATVAVLTAPVSPPSPSPSSPSAPPGTPG